MSHAPASPLHHIPTLAPGRLGESARPWRDPGNRSLHLKKADLRENLLARRRVISFDLRDTTRWKAINNLRSVLAAQRPGIIALYYARGSEIDLTSLAQDLWRDGQTVALPRVVARNHPLTFNIWHEHQPLEPDAIGIPAATGAEVWPSAMVLPMLGYNRSGYRLGAGGGYYDRTLAALPFAITTIGVCYTELEITDFPSERTDRRLDAIVTGKEVIFCR